MCSPKSDVTPAVATQPAKEKKCTGKCKECREKKAREQTLIKTIGVMMLLIFTSTASFAQDATVSTAPSFWTDPFNHPMLPVYIVLGLIFVTVILVAMVGIYMIRINHLLTAQRKKNGPRNWV